MKLTGMQRSEVRVTLTKMEADTGMLFVRMESLRVHLGPDFMGAVQIKLAEALEAMRQLKITALESELADEPQPFL